MYLKFIIILLLFNCRVAWYRQLPSEEDKVVKSYIGVWKKNSNPRSAINSSWHRNQWSEKIIFENENEFRKIYESKDFIGDSTIYKNVEGFGTYQVRNHWILLKTANISLVEFRDDVISVDEKKQIDSSLLYYYYQDKNLIIPMIYDTGYEEKEFGVKDGVSMPFDEKNSNFFRYIKIYAFKEFQSHAYYPEK